MTRPAFLSPPIPRTPHASGKISNESCYARQSTCKDGDTKSDTNSTHLIEYLHILSVSGLFSQAHLKNTHKRLNMSPSATQRTHSIATMGADGIGPEVINAGVQVLKKLAQLDGTFKLRFTDYDWSSETYKKTGQYIPDGGLEQLKKHDAILFGAVGA